MSGAPKVRSMNVADSETRPVLGPAGNKARSTAAVARKPALKPLRKMEGDESLVKEDKKEAPLVVDSHPLTPQMSASTVLKRQELLLRSNFSLNASCSSDASTDSFCSRASTGRIGRGGFSGRRKQSVSKPEKIMAKMEKIVPDDAVVRAGENLFGKKRCAWVTPNSDPAYVAFHDDEWGVPVYDDRRLFELLVLSGALAELTWPAILSRRHIFREVFMDFDPLLVSKINEKKLTAPGSSASSLLSEPKLRGVVENARVILKITEEFGSFNNYCWSFVNQKPITSRFRYPRQVPVKTPKADSISKDMVRRGFRCVGPTVIYSFMQTAGMTNDHLISCYRFDECHAVAAAVNPTDEIDSNYTNGEAAEAKVNGDEKEEKKVDGEADIGMEFVRVIDSVSVS
ncbi:uncharacterized protein LOC110039407 [Phalaenopsis equestris]|uniref:uncharacterized protein LOC110039407 n=1 Tax=Phalaenopsis equestris TaxID=78828 RepID=UPI0009E3C579|nr:uncharacterized protein LOC110039407 [Phalaenopsis equestris]